MIFCCFVFVRVEIEGKLKKMKIFVGSKLDMRSGFIEEKKQCIWRK